MNFSLITIGQAVATFASQIVKQHPKRLTTVLAGFALAGGGAAFAVAHLVPDPSDLPVHELVEVVQPLPVQAQIQALDAFEFNLFRSDISRGSDTADTLLKRMGVDDAAAAAFLRADPLSRQQLLGRAGRSITVETSAQNALHKMVARWSPDEDSSFKRLVIAKTTNGFFSRLETAPMVASTRLAGGVIQTSLFAATDDAAIPDSVATQVAEIFAGDIDFQRALRKGDRFSLVYETLTGDGEVLKAGRVLSAEFVNKGASHQAMWFQEPLASSGGARLTQAKGGYYTLAGESLRRAYLASPLAFSRISSGFQMRMHPIHNTWRAHLGVDFSAASGTAVRAVGDGVVEFAGSQSGFGNVVFIKHRNNHTTVYAHLSKILVTRGQTVNQSQNIGAVGATGWATGPHLHFEFRVNGKHQDPMTIARRSETVPVSTAARPLFERTASAVKLQLAAAASMQQVSAQ